jgi:protein ImuB
MAEVAALLGKTSPGVIEQDDPSADQAALENLARWCQRYTPVVCLEASPRPESLLLEIAGCWHLWGSEEVMAWTIARELSEYRLAVRIGVADTFGAAWAVSRFATGEAPAVVIVPVGQTADALFPLPVEALRLSEKLVSLLRSLGIGRIGQIESLKRSSLAARFEEELLLRLDQAMGRSREILSPHPAPVPIEARRIFEFPVTQLETLLRAIDDLFTQTRRELPTGHGVTRLEVEMILEGSAGEALTTTIPIGFCRPSDHQEHGMSLVRLAMERTRLHRPVHEVRLVIAMTAPLELIEHDLFEIDEHQDRRPWEHLLDRLASRLGADRVLRARWRADAQPERSYEWVPTSSGRFRATRWPATLPRRPIRLGRPRPIRVTSLLPHGEPSAIDIDGRSQRVSASWGPERIETGWWRGEPIIRDYFRVELADGRQLWIFRHRTTDRWYLHGAFD